MEARVMIAGAAGDLGRAVAMRFLADGWRLLLVDRNAAKLAAAYPSPDPRISLRGGIHLTDVASVTTVLQDPVDALVHAVGGYAGSSFLHPVSGVLEALLKANLFSAQATLTAVLPGMIQRGKGTIVVVVGEAALHGTAGSGAYAASKAATLRLVESLAAEAGPSGISTSAVLPGSMDTPSNRANMPEKARSTWSPWTTWPR